MGNKKSKTRDNPDYSAHYQPTQPTKSINDVKDVIYINEPIPTDPAESMQLSWSDTQYEYQSLDAFMTGRWYTVTIRQTVKDLSIFEFKTNSGIFGTWHQLIITNPLTTLIKYNHRYSYRNSKQNECYVRFAALHSYTIPCEMSSWPLLEEDTKTIWFGNCHQNIIRVTTLAIYKYNTNNNEWIIITEIPSTSTPLMLVKYKSEFDKLFILNSYIFAIFDCDKFEWNLIKPRNFDIHRISNVFEIHYDYNTTAFGSSADKLQVMLKCARFQYAKNCYGTLTGTDSKRFFVEDGMIKFSYGHGNYSQKSECVQIYIEKLKRLYAFEDGRIHSIGIDNKCWGNVLKAPWSFIYGSRNIYAVQIELTVVLVIVRDSMFYVDLKDNFIIENDNKLDTTFNNLCGVAYDYTNKMVYFIRNGHSDVIMVNVYYLIPIEARRNELIGGYAREMENMHNFCVPLPLIEVIVSYYPIKKM